MDAGLIIGDNAIIPDVPCFMISQTGHLVNRVNVHVQT
jgi:hypothetical protein